MSDPSLPTPSDEPTAPVAPEDWLCTVCSVVVSGGAGHDCRIPETTDRERRRKAAALWDTEEVRKAWTPAEAFEVGANYEALHCAGERERAEKEADQEERDHIVTMEQRDVAEETCSEILLRLPGQQEWSSMYGYGDMVDDLDNHLGVLEQRAETAESERDEAREALDNSHEDVVTLRAERHEARTELAEARGEVERIEAMGRNLCRICGIDYEAAFLLADKPTVLTKEEIASAVKFFAAAPTGEKSEADNGD